MNRRPRWIKAIVASNVILAAALAVTRPAAAAATTPAGSPPRPAAPAEAASKTALIDINAADVATLTTLPGVGKVIAQRIVDYRKEHGPFRSVDELLNVRGIGERSIEKFRDLVFAGGKK